MAVGNRWGFEIGLLLGVEVWVGLGFGLRFGLVRWDGVGLGFVLSSGLRLWFFPVWFGVLVFVYIGALVYFPFGLGVSLFQFIKNIIRSQRVLKYVVFATCFRTYFKYAYIR